MIKTFHKATDLISALVPYHQIGFIPTMGNLHAGHLSLISAAIQDTPQVIVVSIYVNPTQFEDNTDFKHYPRTLEEDLVKIGELFSNLSGVPPHVFIFAPLNDEEIYPHGKNLIEATGPTTIFEGHLRPGHFNGMVTVVKKFFEITRPTTAYFGKKDYQQCLIVQNLAETYFPELKIKYIPTTRDKNGLALSSRNTRLSAEDLREALVLRSSMLKIEEMVKSKCQLDNIMARIKEVVAKDRRFNYLALVNATSLLPPSNLSEKLVLLGNFQIGEIKLLDNIEF